MWGDAACGALALCAGKAYDEDPLVYHGGLKARWAVQMLQVCRDQRGPGALLSVSVARHLHARPCLRGRFAVVPRAAPTGPIAQTMDRIGAMLPQIQWPFLVLQGSADKLVNRNGAERLFTTAASADKSIKRYDGFYHELLNEPDEDAKVPRRQLHQSAPACPGQP